MKKCGKFIFESSTYLDCVELAAVATVGRVVGAVKDGLLLAPVGPQVGIWLRRHWLDEAGALDH